MTAVDQGVSVMVLEEDVKDTVLDKRASVTVTKDVSRGNEGETG